MSGSFLWGLAIGTVAGAVISQLVWHLYLKGRMQRHDAVRLDRERNARRADWTSGGA